MTNGTSSGCKTLYNKLNSFVTKVINRDVQPQINSLNNSPTNTSREILANSDLNDCTDNGFYYCNLSNSEIATISNCPVTRGFSMFVEKNYTYNETGIKQVVTEHDGATTYIRTFFTDFSNVFHDSGWKQLYGDTGWQTLTITNSNFAHYDNGLQVLQIRKVGRIVELTGSLKNTASITLNATEVNVATIPAEYRPTKHIFGLMQGSQTSVFLVTVNTPGALNVSRYRNSTTYSSVASGSWFPIHLTWIV